MHTEGAASMYSPGSSDRRGKTSARAATLTATAKPRKASAGATVKANAATALARNRRVAKVLFMALAFELRGQAPGRWQSTRAKG